MFFSSREIKTGLRECIFSSKEIKTGLRECIFSHDGVFYDCEIVEIYGKNKGNHSGIGALRPIIPAREF